MGTIVVLPTLCWLLLAAIYHDTFASHINHVNCNIIGKCQVTKRVPFKCVAKYAQHLHVHYKRSELRLNV